MVFSSLTDLSNIFSLNHVISGSIFLFFLSVLSSDFKQQSQNLSFWKKNPKKLKNHLFRNTFENVCNSKLKLLDFLQLYLKRFLTCIWNTFVLSLLLKLLLAWLNVQLVVIYSFCLSCWVKMREDLFVDSFS